MLPLNPVAGPLSSPVVWVGFLFALAIEIECVVRWLGSNRAQRRRLRWLLVPLNLATWTPLAIANEMFLGSGFELIVVGVGELAVVLVEFAVLSWFVRSNYFCGPDDILPPRTSGILPAVVVGNIVSFVLGILMLTAGLRSDPEVDLARKQVNAFADTVKLYYVEEGRLPVSFDELIQPYDPTAPHLTEPPTDPWGTPYKLRHGSTPAQFEVISCGPDRELDTEDDISSRNARSP